MDRSRFDRAAELIRRFSKADDYHLIWGMGESSLTRFADNMITQNVNKEEESISLTSYFGSKMASLSTSRLDEEGIKEFVAKCEKAALESVEDREHMPTVGPSEQIIKHQIDPSVTAIDEKERAEIASRAIERAKAENGIAAGIISNGLSFLGISTKNGAEKFFGKTFLDYSNTMKINNESGAASENGILREQVDIDKAIDSALEDARMLQKRVELEPGRYTVLLSAHAASQLISNMAWYGMNRRAVDEGYSPYSGKIGTKIVDERVNIFTDPMSPDLPARPFDYEGSPVEKGHLIENGVLINIPCSRWWAKEKNIAPWGLGNMIFAGSDTDDDKLLAKIKRGFYIKELWYIRMVKMEDLTLTGMTRNGFFYIEDGLIVSGATHFRWNNSPLQMLNNLIDLGQGKSVYPEWGVPTTIPSLLVDDFYLSSKTLF